MITTKSLVRKPVERESKFAITSVSYDMLAAFLHLPSKYRIVDVEKDFERNGLKIKIEGPDIKPIVEGAETSNIVPGQGEWLEAI